MSRVSSPSRKLPVFRRCELISILAKPSCFVFQLSTKIRKILKLGPNETISLFVKNIILASDAVLGDVYEKYKGEDGFLYVDMAAMESLGMSPSAKKCVNEWTEQDVRYNSFCI